MARAGNRSVELAQEDSILASLGRARFQTESANQLRRRVRPVKPPRPAEAASDFQPESGALAPREPVDEAQLIDDSWRDDL